MDYDSVDVGGIQSAVSSCRSSLNKEKITSMPQLADQIVWKESLAKDNFVRAITLIINQVNQIEGRLSQISSIASTIATYQKLKKQIDELQARHDSLVVSVWYTYHSYTDSDGNSHSYSVRHDNSAEINAQKAALMAQINALKAQREAIKASLDAQLAY